MSQSQWTFAFDIAMFEYFNFPYASVTPFTDGSSGLFVFSGFPRIDSSELAYGPGIAIRLYIQKTISSVCCHLNSPTVLGPCFKHWMTLLSLCPLLMEYQNVICELQCLFNVGCWQGLCILTTKCPWGFRFPNHETVTLGFIYCGKPLGSHLTCSLTCVGNAQTRLDN
jgi:hypothetical protein